MAQRAVLEAQPFQYHDGMEQEMLDELNRKGYAVDRLEISGNDVILDLTPGVYSAFIITGAIAAMVAVIAGVFGITFVSWRMTSILEALTPILLIGGVVIGGIAIAYLMRPPPGGEYLMRGIGYGIATTPGAVAGVARGAGRATMEAGRVAGPVAASAVPLLLA